ncbi:MAG: cell wall hydrolase [Pseudomonadota bacterium]
MTRRFISAVAAAVLAATGVFAQTGADVLGQAVQFETEQLALLDDRSVEELLAKSKARRTSSEIQFDRAWLAAQPSIQGGDEWRCLSEALYFEARGETIKGQFAVAEVILNRVRSRSFPNSICSVVNQGTGKKYQCQFTYTCDGIAEVIAEPRAYEAVGKVARLAMAEGSTGLTNGALFYHTTAVNPRWARVFKHTATIGVHRFYRKS